jgi:hypothetical protein
MEHIRGTVDQSRELSVRDLLKRLTEDKKVAARKEETNSSRKPWKWPWSWRSTMNKGNKGIKSRDHVVVLYLNIKGEIEPPIIVPIYSGNMVIMRNKVHEVDPRAFWTVRVGMKTFKVLIFKEIDRRPVSNLDYSEIKARGDATDSDEFLIKAALKAQTVQKPVGPGMNKLVIIGIVVLAIAALVYFFFFAG